ncbi:ATP-binding protein [uncultured Nitrosomonas sp.]|uniref:sensor histidine kinase n=1 Tax=uncultured Nitrosomonas sp. TaxID=156424 RepID=UPI0025E2DE41|nr:ATP-binding protein [uncultured Nitrosomonas sp.]
MAETESQLKWIKLACLYESSHDMLRIHFIDELCQKLIENIKMIGYSPSQIFPFIDIDDESYGESRVLHTLDHKFSISIMTNGRICGQIGIYSKDIDVISVFENENKIFLQSIADDLGLWLERNRLLDRKTVLLDSANVIESAFNEHAIMAITDNLGKISYVNERFCTVSGYSFDELIGQDHRIVNSDYHSKDFFLDLWSAITKGEVWKGEIKNRAKNGTFYWVAMTIVPFLDDVGLPYQFVAILNEVTGYKLLEQRMEKQVAELARSNDELEQFAYVVTHDLQEPLRAINSFVQLLNKYCHTQLDQRANNLISHAVAGTHRMQQLIDDLLTYAQVDASQEFVKIDCEQLLKEVEADLLVTISECNAIITHDQLPVVRGIRFQFIQLISNLINNALKFRRAHEPKIHIGVKEKSDEWIFLVSDNGIGIEKQYRERIFRVFQQLHSRKDYAGTGIGLAICKKVVEHHGGRIWVNSKLNAGSSFYFTIPKIK